MLKKKKTFASVKGVFPAVLQRAVEWYFSFARFCYYSVIAKSSTQNSATSSRELRRQQLPTIIPLWWLEKSLRLKKKNFCMPIIAEFTYS